MYMTQKLNQLQQAIREVCTELKENETIIAGTVVLTRERKIELQHILRAIPYKRFCNLVMNEEDGTGIVVDDSDLIPYNLLLPLDQQAPEVVDFLHSIICEG